MDDEDIADTVIVPRRADAPSEPARSGSAQSPTRSPWQEPDDSDTVLRAAAPVALVEPALVEPPQGRKRSDVLRESHAAILAPVPPPEQAAARYRYRINGGAIVDLDVVTLVGRHPREPRVRAAEEPALVTVPSPGLEVSSTHVELKQYGASIVVTDMRSTNGTRVIMPGLDPVVLRPGESVVAVPGTVVDIGDDNMIEILPMRRFVPDSPDFDRLIP